MATLSDSPQSGRGFESGETRAIIRRQLILDLYLHRGPITEYITEIRAKYRVSAVCDVPPPPSFRADALGLMTKEQCPWHFHVPRLEPYPFRLNDIPEWAEEARLAYLRQYELHSEHWERYRLAGFIGDIETIWKQCVPGANLNGSDVQGYMPWLPFLTAAVLFDPPQDRLLEFADHDDHETASEIDAIRPTFSVDADSYAAAVDASRHGSKTGDPADLSLAAQLHHKALRSSVAAHFPVKKQGGPVDDLECVQAWLWKSAGMTYKEIAERGDWGRRADSVDETKRLNRVKSRVKKGGLLIGGGR